MTCSILALQDNQFHFLGVHFPKKDAMSYCILECLAQRLSHVISWIWWRHIYKFGTRARNYSKFYQFYLYWYICVQFQVIFLFAFNCFGKNNVEARAFVLQWKLRHCSQGGQNILKIYLFKLFFYNCNAQYVMWL